MLKKKGLIHAIAECKDCNGRWEWFLTAQKLAAAHAKKTGHRVILELGYFVEYTAGNKR